MLTGSNFKRCSGRNADIERSKLELEKARNKWELEYRKPEESFDSNRLWKAQRECEIAEYNLWCAEYEDNRQRNWR